MNQFMDHEKSLNIAQSEKTENAVKPFKRKVFWNVVIFYIVAHIAAVYGLYLALTSSKLLTFVWGSFLAFICGQGVSLGAHRMYAHRAVKGTWVMRLLLVGLQTLANQHSMYIWVRDHRQHHKYSDTDSDPHNANRGFFFSHLGWLMSNKHPNATEKQLSIDMSDLEADPIVMFQYRHYTKLFPLIGIVIPTLVPYYCWNETLCNSFFFCTAFRWVYTLNVTCLVNSAAHAFGNRPFTKNIIPVENGLVSALTFGEGWHNYHHTFPWDYRASELGQYYNFTTTVIDYLSQYGLLYDLKTPTPEMVIHRILKQGDGTHLKLKELSRNFKL